MSGDTRMETNLPTSGDPQLHDAAQRLLAAALAYWREYARVTGGNGVVWLAGSGGELVILTRGEYRDTLMQNVDRLRRDAIDLRPFNDAPPPE